MNEQQKDCYFYSILIVLYSFIYENEQSCIEEKNKCFGIEKHSITTFFAALNVNKTGTF